MTCCGLSISLRGHGVGAALSLVVNFILNHDRISIANGKISLTGDSKVGLGVGGMLSDSFIR